MLRLLLCSFLLLVLCLGRVSAQPQGPATHIISASVLPARCSPNSGDIFNIPLAGFYRCDSINHWALISSGSGGTTNGTCSFIGASTCSITLTGVVSKAVVSCYDNSGLNLLLPNDFIGSTADTLVINFSAPSTGYCNASTGVGLTGATGATGPAGPTIVCPGGSAGQVQFNISAGVCGGDSNLTWDNTTKTLAVGAASPTAITDGSVTALNLPNIKINVRVAPYYASGSATTTTTSGTFGVGASGAIASCSTFSAGQGIFITGAGAASADYVGTVVSCSAGALVVTPSTGTSVSNGTLVQHDDTAAFQGAVTALTTTGGVIFTPDGTYRINGLLQDTSGANGRIIMPSLAIQSNGELLPVPTIAIVGETTPAYSFANSPSTFGTILISQLSGGNMISAKGPTALGANMTCVYLYLKNLTFRMPDNPNQTAVNANWIAMFQAENLNFDTNVAWYSQTLPSHSNGRALIMPRSFNYAISHAKNVGITGYYTGMVVDEHNVLDDVSMYQVLHAIEPTANSYGHALAWSRVLIQHCPYGIYPTGSGTATIAAQEVNFEHWNVAGTGPAWGATTDDIYDPGNLLNGELNWHSTTGAVGVDTSILINGATNLFIRRLDNFSVSSLSALGFSGMTAKRAWTVPDANFSFLTTNAAVTFAQGGTGLATAADDTLLLSTGSAWVATAVPDCPDTGGNHLNYTTSNNSFGCGTSGGGGGGGGTVTSLTATSPVVVTPSPTTATGVISLDPTVDFAFTHSESIAIASTSTGTPNGLVVKASTAAANNAQQYSPCIDIQSLGWSTSNSASRATDWCLQNQAFQGAANPSSYLIFWSSINGGSYANKFQLGSDGTALFAGQITANGGLIGASGQTVQSTYFTDQANAKGYFDASIAGFDWIVDNKVNGNVNLAVRAKSSQTADLLQFLAAGGTTVLMKIDVLGNVSIVPQAAATGQRYVCIDTNGKLVSSVAACVGT